MSTAGLRFIKSSRCLPVIYSGLCRKLGRCGSAFGTGRLAPLTAYLSSRYSGTVNRSFFSSTSSTRLSNSLVVSLQARASLGSIPSWDLPSTPVPHEKIEMASGIEARARNDNGDDNGHDNCHDNCHDDGKDNDTRLKDEAQKADDTTPKPHGYEILQEPCLNKGLSFSAEERVSSHLTGLIPGTLESTQAQVARCMKAVHARSTNLEKYLYLSSLKAENHDLFYRTLMDHVQELMPLVYTPTIGDVCLQYSELYTRPEALYISIKDRKSIRNILGNWPYAHPDICVVTDGSRILGLGDLGFNGVGIPIGKLSLYTAAAGIHPEKTLPIVLDCGTDNEAFLKDPSYLGLRSKRVAPQEAQDFMDDFMAAAAHVYPDMLVQFEDFETEKAFGFLSRYRDKYKCFNDDIQGTGAVVLAGYIRAVELSGVPLEEQRLVFMGAGSAGVGVAKQMLEYYTRRGLTEQEAKDKFWLVDTKGLVTTDRGDNLAAHKRYFARHDMLGHQLRTLDDVLQYVRPSALVGLTATFGVFTEPVVRALKACVEAGGKNRRPILFPLSNPLSKAECTFEQAIQWTGGSVIFASGSPFKPFSVETAQGSATHYPNQGNNVYVFPGIGLGAILSKATRVTDEMIYTAAEALSLALSAAELANGLIYPEIERVRAASSVVAREVIKAARREGVSTLSGAQWAELEAGDGAIDKYIKERMYDPLK